MGWLLQLSEGDQDLYKNFPLVISERWQQEITDTVFEVVNQETDKLESKKKSKVRSKQYDQDEKSSDCILHGYVKRLGGPFSTQWHSRYAKLFPNRLELHQDNGKPEVTITGQIVAKSRPKSRLLLVGEPVKLQQWIGPL